MGLMHGHKQAGGMALFSHNVGRLKSHKWFPKESGVDIRLAVVRYTRMRTLSPGHHLVRDKLMVMQNRDYVLLDYELTDLSVPFFVTVMSPSDPGATSALVRMHVTEVGDLPDVRLYTERNLRLLRSGKADEYDRAMLGESANSTGYKIPTHVYLPGTIVSEGRECEVVYELDDLRLDSNAIVTIYSVDGSVPVKSGSVIRRRARGASGNWITKDIATVL